MNILTIPLRCTRQKWPRVLALLCIFLLGVASIVALYKVSVAVGEGFEKKLTAFGANIIISPKRETLTVSYGGIPLGDMLMDEGRLPLAPALSGIRGIALSDRLSVVAPKLVGIVRHEDKPLALVGVDFPQELELKQFWNVQGHFPGEKANGKSDDSIPGMDKSSRSSMALPFAPEEHAPGHAANSAPGEPQATVPGMSSDAAHSSMTPDSSTAAHSPASSTMSGANEVLAGSALAKRLGLVPGSHLQLGQDGHAGLMVSGVLHPTGSDDDNVLFVSLPIAQALLHADDSASFIEVAALCSACPIEDIVSELQAALPGVDVKALRHVVAQRMYSINFARNLALIVALVIMVSACAMVVMSMLSAVNERRKEIGILRAIGYSRGAVFVIFAVEALGIGCVAGFAGYVLGLEAGRHILETLSIEAATLPPFNFPEMLLCGLASGLVAVLAATFPAWKAGRVDPATALASL